MEKFIKVIRAIVKDVNAEKHTLTAVISTKKVDRDGDIVEPASFKARIKVYKEHPVLLSSHNYSDLRKQIGKANKVTITDDEVSAEFEYFVGQGNPEADWAWVLAQRGIASYSVGFIGHKSEWIKDKFKEEGTDNVIERITGRRFLDIELMEVSQVLIPSNRGALQMGLTMAGEEKELCEMAIKSFEKGELKELAPAETETKDNHYTEELLGAEGQPTSEPKEEPAVVDEAKAITEMVKGTVSAIVNK
jgi:hypothetical protein